jgi:hypothetical protein
MAFGPPLVKKITDLTSNTSRTWKALGLDHRLEPKPEARGDESIELLKGDLR